MHLIDLFWLTTLIPGFAVLQVFFPQDMHRGFLATVAWSYMVTVALMAPIVALAFTVHFSVQTVAAIYLVLVLGGAVVAMRAGGVGRAGRLLKSTRWFEVGLAIFVIALAFPLGASAQSDSFAHSAKIRFMRDVGFYLQDAYSPLTVIETKWPVSVHHAFFAIASWIGHIEPLDLWFRSSWFFRLLALGAFEFLAVTVFRSRWIGATVMLAAVAVLGTRLTIVFPFSVTAYAIAPVLLALVIDLLERPSGTRYAKVVLASLSLAVLHVGTWLLAVICIGPAVAIWTMWRRPLKQSGRALVLAAATLATGIPFLLVSALQPNYVKAQQDALHVRMIRTFEIHGWSITIIDPTQYAWLLPLIASLGLLAVVSRSLRSRVLMLAVIVFAGMAFMFIPGLYDLLILAIPYWLLQRFRMFDEVIGIVMVSGAMVWMVRPRLRTPMARRAMALLVLCGSLAIFRGNILGFVQESTRQRRWLAEAHKLQEAVSVIPAHSLVVANPEWSLVLPAVHLARVMGEDLHHANPSDGGLLGRYADAQEFLADGTSDERRREIIRKHGIRFILLHDEPGQAAADRFGALGTLVSARNGFRVYQVTP